MATEYIHELGDSLSTGASSNGPHVKVIAPEKYKESGSETYKTISVEINSKYTKPSGGIPKSDLAGAVQASLVNNVTLGNSKALAITMPYTLRTGRSTALVLVSGNNAKYCLMEIGWFKVASTAIASNRIYSHVLACYDTAQDCVPKVYITYGASGVDSVIYLVLSNSSSGSEWATQVSVMLNCEHMDEVSISAVDTSVATSATDVSGGTVYNVDSRNVLGSSSSSSWSGDNTNIPTRGAVEDKILATILGNVGGFLGAWVPSNVYNYQTLGGHDYRTGDYVAITEDGTVIYYENNNRSGSTTSLTVSEGNEIYWTTSGKFEIMPSNSLQVYNYSTLSDWNDMTVPGLYQVSVSNATNAPASGTYSCLVSNVSGNIRQVAMSGTNIYYRGKGSQSGWTSWKNVSSVDNATFAEKYMYGGQEFSIATRFNELSAAISNTLETWMLVNNSANWVKYNSHTGAVIDTGSLQSQLFLNEIIYTAGSTTTLDLRLSLGAITSDEKFALFPPYGYCGVNGSTEIRRSWKQFVHYRLTIYNTSDVSATLYAVCGGRATINRTGYWERGTVTVDYTEYSTPNTSPSGWDVGWLNKREFATINGHKWGIWDVWWYRVQDTPGPVWSGHDYLFITTLKAPQNIV